MVRFSQPYVGATLVKEKALVLVDRTFWFGDVVKKQSSNAKSGTVIRSLVHCNLQPMCTGLPFDKAHSWPYTEPDNTLRQIPASELRHMRDFKVGNCIIYYGWVGLIRDVFEEVTVRLENGSIVAVEDPYEIEVFAPQLSDYSSEMNLAQILACQRQEMSALYLLDSHNKDHFAPPDKYYSGQIITTKKGNLRRGRWVYGQYDPTIPPSGIVVEVKIKQIDVHWITNNLFDKDRTQISAPPTFLDRGDFEQVFLYDRGRTPPDSEEPYPRGSTPGFDIVTGGYVTFRDVPGAAVKYGSGGVHGEFRRIPRQESQGYDMNVLLVTQTTTRVTVQWEDTTISELDAVALIPYHFVDDHDTWPGEIVATKKSVTDLSLLIDAGQTGEESSDLIKPEQIGVVQSTNASEQLANVRWYTNPKIAILDENDTTLVPGSELGPLSTETTEVSLYDLVMCPVVARRRRDLVIIAPSEKPLLPLYPRSARPPTFIPEVEGQNIVNTRDTALDSQIDWFGEVVDLGLDGLITVRLGALERVRDVRVSIENVFSVIGDDDSVGISEESLAEDEERSWTDSMSIWEDRVISETVEYEGGARLDADSGEEMWTTDDENSDALGTVFLREEKIESRKTQDSDVSESIPAKVRPQEVRFTNFESMPTQFEILEETVPRSHHYFSKVISLPATFLRRIRQEHSILESSLPEGIWVRTWSDRLDLLRVLIIGPENTPYALAPFVIDFHFRASFPQSPPEAFFHCWTKGTGRINPNLYENGKVCLSLLGTWPGDTKDEGWSESSTMLQVLVSLMGLVLVKEPFYSKCLYGDLTTRREKCQVSLLAWSL